MKLSDLDQSELSGRLKRGGLGFQAGRFSIQLKSSVPSIFRGLLELYGDYPLTTSPFTDFHVSVARAKGARRWYRPQAVFGFNGAFPFAPLPLEHAFPLMEWGLNWCVTNHCHQYLVVHAAVVEKSGRALILPGLPGSGKSTLCAALTGTGGWRLLSDELTMIDPVSKAIIPTPRPISLKNDSISLIQRFAPDGIVSDPVRDTIKGTVAHVRPPASSVDQISKPAPPSLVVFPKYDPTATSELRPLAKGRAFLRLTDQSFNYSILGKTGFQTIAATLDASDCYEYFYDGDLRHAVTLFDSLVDP